MSSQPSNTKHKDSLFSLLFNTPENLKELYEALTGIDLPQDTVVEINTLDNVLYKGQLNDLSFTINNQLVVLIEHQSTINPNMPLRLLMYVGRLYEKIMGDRGLYSSAQLPVPRPLFYVLYNGAKPYPEKEILKLSSLFIALNKELVGKENPNQLELEVTVYNINEGQNQEILQRSQNLGWYSAFIDRIRLFMEDGLNREEAFTAAIDYCKHHDIMKEFLDIHSSEVFNMLTTVWNLDDALAIWKEEGKLEGKMEGKLELIQQLLAGGVEKEKIQQIAGITIEELEHSIQSYQ